MQHERQILEERLHALEHELQLLEKNLGRAEDDADFKPLSRHCREKRAEIEELSKKIEQTHPKQQQHEESPEAPVEKAVRLFDQIERLAKDPQAGQPCRRCSSG